MRGCLLRAETPGFGGGIHCASLHVQNDASRSHFARRRAGENPMPPPHSARRLEQSALWAARLPRFASYRTGEFQLAAEETVEVFALSQNPFTVDAQVRWHDAR